MAISIGWPVISVLHPAASRSRCRSWPRRCRPPAGSTTGPRSSAAPGWGWFTGWFNLIGLVAVTASVDYARGDVPELDAVASTACTCSASTSPPPACSRRCTTCSCCSCSILIVHALINIFSSPPGRAVHQISVWWHVIGVLVIIVLLVAVPEPSPELQLRLRPPQNLSGFSDHMYWFYVLPLGLPADDVHDHRLRRLGAHLRGDARRRDGGAQGRVAVGLLLGRVRLDRAAGADLRRHAHEGDRRGGRDLAVDHRDGADARRRPRRCSSSPPSASCSAAWPASPAPRG